MHVHVALFRWKPGVGRDEVDDVLRRVEALEEQVPGILEITCAENTSQYANGFSHVVFIRAETAEAIEVYRYHPEHLAVVEVIDRIEDGVVAADLITRG